MRTKKSHDKSLSSSPSLNGHSLTPQDEHTNLVHCRMPGNYLRLQFIALRTTNTHRHSEAADRATRQEVFISDKKRKLGRTVSLQEQQRLLGYCTCTGTAQFLLLFLAASSTLNLIFTQEGKNIGSDENQLNGIATTIVKP